MLGPGPPKGEGQGQAPRVVEGPEFIDRDPPRTWDIYREAGRLNGQSSGMQIPRSMVHQGRPERNQGSPGEAGWEGLLSPLEDWSKDMVLGVPEGIARLAGEKCKRK